MIALIDSSYFHIYNLGALEKYYKYADKPVDLFSESFMEHYCKTWIDKITYIYKNIGPLKIYFCRDDRLFRLWRKLIYSDYKSNRPINETEQSLFLRKFYMHNFKYLCYKYNCDYIKLTGLEGDDIIASLVYKFNKDNILIIANDKDLQQLISKNVTMMDLPNLLNKTNGNSFEYSDVRNLIINGDKSDNIKKYDKKIKTFEDYEKDDNDEKKLFYQLMFNLYYSYRLHRQLFKYYLGKKYLYRFDTYNQFGIVINRPSKINKSPYLADVYLEDEKKNEMVHTPSLGMCGYISTDATVLIAKNDNTNSKRKTNYNLLAVKVFEKEISAPGYVWIGANPLVANKLFKIMLENNLVSNLSSYEYLEIKPEFKLNDKRIDFYIYDKLSKEKIFVEVKHLPIVDFLDPPKKKIKGLFDEKDYRRCSVFPDGSTSNKKDGCISIRAYQHLEELEKVVKLGHRGILVMIALRNDTFGFYPNYINDKKYTEKFYKVIDSGVEIQGYKMKYNTKGIRFGGTLPLIPKDKLNIK